MKPVDLYGIIIFHPKISKSEKMFVHQPAKDSTLTDLKQLIKQHFQIKHDDIYLSYEQGSKAVIELNQLTFGQFISSIHIYKLVIVRERKDDYRKQIKSINQEDIRQINEETSDSKQQQIDMDNFPAIQKNQIIYEINDILAVDFVKVRPCLENLSINILSTHQIQNQQPITSNFIQNIFRQIQSNLRRETQQFAQKQLDKYLLNIDSEHNEQT